MRRLLVRSVAVIGSAGLVVAGAGAVQAAPRAVARPAAPAVTPKLGPGGRVIVLLKNHTTPFSARTAGDRAAAASARTDVSALGAKIAKSGGRVSHSYSIINGLSATVTQSEANALAADPSVAEVVPDQPIRANVPSATNATAAAGTAPVAGACAPDGKVKLEPEALETTHADSDVKGAKTARSLGYTGAGVTVAWIADGLDPNNPDFIRNGKSIFTDYEDFSGDGPAAPTGGDEAFLDASAIAAQGNQTYDISKFSALPLSTACKIRVEGEAPGVDLVGLNIFGNEDSGYNSTFVQAIQYAATTDHVNVLNESLGSNFYPDDSGSLDAVKAANDAATALGVTVTVSSGDAGVTSTIGTPSTDPNVISVGGSTTYRFYLQTGYGGARLPGITGWLSNNISSLSSGGFRQDGHTVDLVAPGDLNWAVCSTNQAQFYECASFTGAPSGLEESGGTSESAPVTAGVAALVIQAYRQGHSGRTPTPAVVKSILTSTADDIRAPAEQQGAGLVDAYQAVLLARSYKEQRRSGQTLLASTGQFAVAGSPGSAQTLKEKLTNEGAATQTVSATGRALGSYHRVKATSVTLSDSDSPKYTDFQGISDNYEKVTFTVPASADRLNASIAFQNASATNLAARVRMDLVDPNGKLASYSLPQGDGNYGNGEVADPAPGKWTAYIESRVSSAGGTQGVVQFAASTASFVAFGTVSPKKLTLAPGQTGTVTMKVRTGSRPGDTAGALVLTSAHEPAGVAATTTVPVTLRSVIPAGTQRFSDTLTGGNGRAAYTGESFYYAVTVPSGSPELNASVTLADNPANTFYTYLVSPTGQARATAANQTLTTVGGGTAPAGLETLGATAHVLAPAAGRWIFIVVFAPQVSGTAISEPFTVDTSDKAVPASATGLPTSSKTVIKSGKSKTVYVTVKNTGKAPEAFFVDPRRNQSSIQSLVSLTDPTTTAPLHYTSNIPAYLIPSETTAITAAAQTSGPADIQLDVGAPTGDPDVVSNIGKSVSAGYADASGGQSGATGVFPTEVGPFHSVGTDETVSTQMYAYTRDFDTAVTSATGDLWLTSVDPDATLNTITVNPGQTATIPVTITASGPRRTVTGTLFVDDADLFTVYGGLSPAGNEVAALPYSYTVG